LTLDEFIKEAFGQDKGDFGGGRTGAVALKSQWVSCLLQ